MQQSEIQSNAEGWEESKDKELADWKRVRLAIEHENTLTNYRLMWFILSQGFLFNAFALTFEILIKPDINSTAFRILVLVVSVSLTVVGFWVSVYLETHLHVGETQHNKLYNWWNKKYGEKTGFGNEKCQKYPKLHPPICGHKFGEKEGWAAWFTAKFPPYNFPVIFAVCWFIFLICSIVGFFMDTTKAT